MWVRFVDNCLEIWLQTSQQKVVFRFISKNFKLKSQTRKRKQQQDYSESGVYLLVIYFKSMYIAKVILSVTLNAEIVGS